MSTTSLRFVLTFGLACLATASAALAQNSNSAALDNWAQWRGPISTGVAPHGDPPTEWSETKNVKWKVKVPGDSTATPIIWGDKIFLTTAIETEQEGEPEPPPEEFAATSKVPEGSKRGFRTSGKAPTHIYEFVVLCLDRASGKTLWQQTAKEAVPHEGHHPDGSFAAASPSTDGQRLYVSFGSRGVYCYDFSGKQLWHRDLGRMWTFNTFGEGASPVVRGDAVIVNWDHQSGSFLVCLDAATGETRWKVDREENTTWATPLLVDVNGLTQVIVHGSTRVRSYDLKTGELIWACGGQGPSAIPTPVADGERVYAMTGFITNSLYAIPLTSSGDITKEDDKIAWKLRKVGTPYVPSPLLVDNLLYFTAGNKGILSCFNAKTGEVIVEKQRLEGIANIYASPVGAAGRIYFTSREGATVVFEQGKFEKVDDKNEVKIIATNQLDDRIDASAAIVGHEIFLRGREHLYCIAVP
jgi:outer membrane protein assembly factor BamB